MTKENEREEEVREKVSVNCFEEDDEDFQMRSCGSWEASGGYLPFSTVKSEAPQESLKFSEK